MSSSLGMANMLVLIIFKYIYDHIYHPLSVDTKKTGGMTNSNMNMNNANNVDLDLTYAERYQYMTPETDPFSPTAY